MAQAASPAGHYVLRGVMEVGSELLLKPDGTFEFALAYGATDYYAKGTWRDEKGDVILNSEGKDEPPFRLTRSAITKAPGIRVRVHSPDNQPASQIDVVIVTPAGRAAGRTGDDGSVEFADKSGATTAFLHIRVYDVQAGPFALDPKQNEYDFELNADAVTRVPFKDERLKQDGTILILLHYGADHPMRYEKQ